MFRRLIREINKLSEGGKISISIDSDSKCYLDKECPNEECLYKFKVFEDDWRNKCNDEVVYCPKFADPRSRLAELNSLAVSGFDPRAFQIRFNTPRRNTVERESARACTPFNYSCGIIHTNVLAGPRNQTPSEPRSMYIRYSSFATTVITGHT